MDPSRPANTDPRVTSGPCPVRGCPFTVLWGVPGKVGERHCPRCHRVVARREPGQPEGTGSGDTPQGMRPLGPFTR